MATATKKTVTFTPPKTLAQAADQYYSTREQRLALQRQVDELQAQETALKDHLIDKLPLSSATGIAGKLVRVAVVSKTVYNVEDWDAVRGYIKANAAKNPGVWGLMNKTLNQKTVGEMWEAGKKVPGVVTMDVKNLSYSAL